MKYIGGSSALDIALGMGYKNIIKKIFLPFCTQVHKEFMAPPSYGTTSDCSRGNGVEESNGVDPPN